MPNLPKILIALFALFTIHYSLFPSPAHALVSTGQGKFENALTKGYNKESFDLQSVSDMVSSLNTAIAGCQDQSCPPELKTGALNTVSVMIAGLYINPPASGVAYFADVLNNFGISTPAYAQAGTGFTKLSPLLPIWKAFRNFAYVIFVIIFVVIGIAIMFRFKLNPQTVITIQSALPKIVIALLLVTFSYAIAGLMVDFLYVLISLVILIFGTAGANTTELQNQFLTGGFGAVWGNLWGIVGGSNAAIISGLTAIVTYLLLYLVVVPAAIPVAIGFGAGLLLLIFLILILYIMFRLFIELLMAYISIIISVVLGPLQIALGVIPGFPGFGAWFKNLLANILIFPAVAFVIILAQRLTSGGIVQDLWHPPLLAGGGLVSSALPILVGLGMLLIVYQVPKAIKDAFGIKGLGFVPGEALGVVTGPAAAGMEGKARKATGFAETAFWSTGAGLLKGVSGGRR